MNEESKMGITRSPKLEVNLNTFIQIFTLASMIIGGVAIWIDKSRDIEELQSWRAGHEDLHKERLAEVRGVEARTDERIRSLEADTRKAAAKIETLDYRITVTEQSTTSTSGAIRELQSLVSQQAGDIKVVREILQRIEAGQLGGSARR